MRQPNAGVHGIKSVREVPLVAGALKLDGRGDGSDCPDHRLREGTEAAVSVLSHGRRQPIRDWIQADAERRAGTLDRDRQPIRRMLSRGVADGHVQSVRTGAAVQCPV